MTGRALLLDNGRHGSHARAICASKYGNQKKSRADEQFFHVRSLLFDADQIGQYVRFFGGCAFARQHIFAVAAEPFIALGQIGKTLRVESRRHGANRFACAGMLACTRRRRAMARGARPFPTVFCVEKCLPQRRAGRGFSLLGKGGELTLRICCPSAHRQ